MLRLAIARLRFCSNSFTPRRTRSEDVLLHEWHSGGASLDQHGDGGSELDGVRHFLASHPNWSATVLRSAAAPAGGPLTASLFSSWLNEVESGLKRGRFDAVYLSLHGACQAEGDPTADLTILRRVRGIMGPLPVVASFDWRANLSEEVAILLDGATSNHPTRRGSEAEAAIHALGLLEKITNGTHRPVGALARLPNLVVGGEIALHEMIDAELRNLPQPIVGASIFTGFAWGDSPFTGASALVWTDRDSGLARETAARLAMTISRTARPLLQAPTSVDNALREAMAAQTTAPDQQSRPAVLIDVADNPMNGSLLDTPDMLRSLQRAEAFGQLPGRAVFAALCDPEIVAAARKLGLGATLSGNFGAQSTPVYGPTVPVVAQIVSLGRLGDGSEFALLRAGQLDMVVLSRRPQIITPELLAACGCDLAGARIIALKGGSAVRAAFEHIASTLIDCDCPGPTHPDLLRLPYHFVPSIRRAALVDERHAAGLAAELSGTVRLRRNGERRSGLTTPSAMSDGASLS